LCEKNLVADTWSVAAMEVAVGAGNPRAKRKPVNYSAALRAKTPAAPARQQQAQTS
jgi:hypothetical protein